MAEDDIYGSKRKYERFKARIDTLTVPPDRDLPARRGRRKYYCKNAANLKYYHALCRYVESRDLSYVRRTRLLQAMSFITHATERDLAECEREDVNEIMAKMHETHVSPESKKTFVKQIKYLWKVLLPELDERGRPDSKLVPYPVRHLSGRIDRSREKLRKDKLSAEEVERIVTYFSDEPRLQAYLTLAVESLGRPQELLYLKIGDVEMHDNYAKIFLGEHGKEGVGLLQCIDSYPYLLRWLDVHPLSGDRDAFLFVNMAPGRRGRQMTPANINKNLRAACKALSIDKPITCYSLKRNGVTLRRLRGESDMEIQHAARWTSTKQLKTYDLSSQDEAFKAALQKRGLLAESASDSEAGRARDCPFCGERVGFAQKVCVKCRHVVDRGTVLDGVRKDEEIERLKAQVAGMNDQMAALKEQVMQELMQVVLSRKKDGSSSPVDCSSGTDGESAVQ